MPNPPQKVDWSHTETFIEGPYGPYRLFGLHGQQGSDIVRWWFGDASHEPARPGPSSSPFGGWLALALVVSVPLTMLRFGLPPEKIPDAWRGLYEPLVNLGTGLLLLFVAGSVVYMLWVALRSTFFPTAKDSLFDEQWKQEREFAETTRTLTVALWLGNRRGEAYQVKPLKLDRYRHSPRLNMDTLPRDRIIYVTLHDLTDAEFAELKKRLGFMDL